MTEVLLPKYGYVPFKHFQYVMIGLQLLMIFFHKSINSFLNTHFFDSSYPQQTLKKIILTIPLISIAYFDIFYSSFSFKNLGLYSKYNDKIDSFFWILGSYAIIHVLAQDTGIKLGVDQRETIQTHAMFIIISFSMAYSLTTNRSQSLIALLLYYHIKYVISDNIV